MRLMIILLCTVVLMGVLSPSVDAAKTTSSVRVTYLGPSTTSMQPKVRGACTGYAEAGLRLRVSLNDARTETRMSEVADSFSVQVTVPAAATDYTLRCELVDEGGKVVAEAEREYRRQ